MAKGCYHPRSQQGLLVYSPPVEEDRLATTLPKMRPGSHVLPAAVHPACCSVTTVFPDLASPPPPTECYFLSPLLTQGFCFEMLQTKDLANQQSFPPRILKFCQRVGVSFRLGARLLPPCNGKKKKMKRRPHAFVRAEVKGQHGRTPRPVSPLILGLPTADVRDGIEAQGTWSTLCAAES